MRTITVAIASMACGLLLAPGIEAQEVTDASACWRRVGDLGINGLGGSMRLTRRDDGTFLTRFYTEPRVLAVEGVAEPELRVGDVLTAVDGRAITTPEGGSRFSDVQPGQSVTLGIRRAGEARAVTLTAGSRCLPKPAESTRPAAGVARGTGAAARLSSALPAIPPDVYAGFSFRCSDCQIQMNGGESVWRFPSRLNVTEVQGGSPAARAGLRPGDEILSVDGQEITSAAGGRAFSLLSPGTPVAVAWRRPDGSRHEGVLVPEEPRSGGRGVGSRDGGGDLRYTGMLDRVGIEVRGRPVVVTRDEGTGQVTIEADGLVVTLRQLAGQR